MWTNELFGQTHHDLSHCWNQMDPSLLNVTSLPGYPTPVWVFEYDFLLRTYNKYTQLTIFNMTTLQLSFLWTLTRSQWVGFLLVAVSRHSSTRHFQARWVQDSQTFLSWFLQNSGRWYGILFWLSLPLWIRHWISREGHACLLLLPYDAKTFLTRTENRLMGLWRPQNSWQPMG